MADIVQIQGTNHTAKVRSVVWVIVLAIVTLGIYVIFWWYFVNREMADYGQVRGRRLGDSPVKSTLALFPGGLIIVPAIWTVVTTFKRVQAAQRLTGQPPINGWIGLILYVVFSPAYQGYMQSGLNSGGGQASAEPGGQVAEEAGAAPRSRATPDSQRGTKTSSRPCSIASAIASATRAAGIGRGTARTRQFRAARRTRSRSAPGATSVTPTPVPRSS